MKKMFGKFRHEDRGVSVGEGEPHERTQPDTSVSQGPLFIFLLTMALTFEGFQTVYQPAIIYSSIICKTGAHTSQPSGGQYTAAVSAGHFPVMCLINSLIFCIPRVQKQGIKKNFRAYMSLDGNNF